MQQRKSTLDPKGQQNQLRAKSVIGNLRRFARTEREKMIKRQRLSFDKMNDRPRKQQHARGDLDNQVPHAGFVCLFIFPEFALRRIAGPN